MATKKPTISSKPKTKPKPEPQPGRLHNLAARPDVDLGTIDEQLVDNSGVFRVTSQISQAQTGHGEESSMFPNESLVIAAQRGGFRDDGVTIDETIEQHAVEDEASRAEKKNRLATLAARHQARTRPRRR